MPACWYAGNPKSTRKRDKLLGFVALSQTQILCPFIPDIVQLVVLQQATFTQAVQTQAVLPLLLLLASHEAMSLAGHQLSADTLLTKCMDELTSCSADSYFFDLIHRNSSLRHILLIFVALQCNSTECRATVLGDPRMQGWLADLRKSTSCCSLHKYLMKLAFTPFTFIELSPLASQQNVR